MLTYMACCTVDHAALRDREGVPAGTLRDLVDDEGPARCDTYEQVNVTCACGAVFSFYRLVASVPVDAAYIAREHARASAAADAAMGAS